MPLDDLSQTLSAFGRDVQWRRFGWEPGAPFLPSTFAFHTTEQSTSCRTIIITPPHTGLSYYGLSLLSYLRESHPDLADDADFIRTRAQAAAEAYSRIIRSGGSRIEAAEEADAVLYRGLHFSLYSTLANIIRSEFAEDIPEEDAREAALILLPQAKEVARSYELTDDFAATPQYERLYTELTGTVQILLDNGIQ